MLSISAMSGGQGAYYTGLAREDYYLEGGEPPGAWLGVGAEVLGARGEVDKELFSRLFEGFDDNGNPLVQNAGDPSRQAGWDLTFSAPKSVSALWSLLPAEQGAEIRAAHAAAVQAACAYLQDEAGWTRRGKGGVLREKVKLVIGVFEHGTSRAGDPQLHSHALVLNLGVRQDGTTGTIESKPLYIHKMAAGALYRAELAAQLERRLGVQIEKVKSCFEVKGVSKQLMELWSTRRKEIEAALAKSGYSGAKASEMAALSTRQGKLHVAREALFAVWQQTGEAVGWGREQALALCLGPHQKLGEMPAVAQALATREAIEQLTRQQAYFSERELVRRTAEASQGWGIDAGKVREAVKEYLSEKAIVLTKPHRGESLYTTPEMLRLEEKMLRQVEQSRGSTRHRVAALPLKIAELASFKLNAEQKEALAHITREKGSLAVVSGMAGTGKTTMLKAAAILWKLQGYEVRGAALSGKAAKGLEEGAGIKSSTIAKLLYFDTGKKARPLTRKTILVVDEAGMVGTRDMAALVEAARKARAKIVLVGDARQLQPIEAGGPFAAIAKRLGEARLSTIVRQKEEWNKQVVHDLADGRANAALHALAARGLVTVADDKQGARQALLASWKPEGLFQPKDALILASTNLDAAILNREAQSLRREAGKLSPHAIKVGEEKFHIGDRVLFTKNAPTRGLRNGDLGTVLAADKVTRNLLVKLDDGARVLVPTLMYSHVKLGYAVTTHKSQGMTTRRAYVLTDEAMQDKELSYVQASRAREETRLFTTKAEAGESLTDLAASMRNSRQKLLASDLSPVTPRDQAIAHALSRHQENSRRQEIERLELRQGISL